MRSEARWVEVIPQLNGDLFIWRQRLGDPQVEEPKASPTSLPHSRLLSLFWLLQSTLASAQVCIYGLPPCFQHPLHCLGLSDSAEASSSSPKRLHSSLGPPQVTGLLPALSCPQARG